ncbi:protein HGH1 homolog isoform X1 [Hydra vulgaris]|uniref:Protein HGH1 homolog n=1 Tax=Hydra vulgaris TaxID=6087 RepID=T2M5W5_HYDVU|nr:protein HGH1 homolog [Hydra vulgaris]
MASSDEINTAMKEILQFIDTLSPADYKNNILEYILGMTGTAEGLKTILNNDLLIKALKKLILYDENEKARLNSLKIVVNITSMTKEDDLIRKFLEPLFIKVMLTVATEPESECSDLVAMLLTNITQAKNNAEVVLDCILNNDNFSLNKFIDAFCNENYNKKGCSLHYIGSFLANLTLCKETRHLFLKKDECLLKRLLPFTEYEKSLSRRLSVSRIIKNCLFETDYHEWLLSDDIDIIIHLLMPLAGPEEFTPDENECLPLDLQYLPDTKQREKNKDVQILLCESLFQLCATKSCRLQLKNNGTYYVLREFHRSLDNDDVIEEPLVNLIQVLIGDEPEPGMDNLRTLEIPEHIQKQFTKIESEVTQNKYEIVN